MRILLINQTFHPDVVATAQHMTDWARYMAAQGHDVTVIASRSLYGQSKSALPKKETWSGIRIIRVGGNFFAKGRVLTRLIDFSYFQFLALIRTLTLPRQDVVVCLTTPPFIGVVGMLAKWFRRSRYVQYEMDLYPDVPILLGVIKPHGMIARLFHRLHRRLLRSADHIVVLGRCMARVIAAKGIAAEKMVLVTPWADPDEITPPPSEQNAFRREHDLPDAFVVMYAGNLGLGHDVTTLCQAMRRLEPSTRDVAAAALGDDKPPNSDPWPRTPDRGLPPLRFVFVGGGRRMAEVRAFIEAHHLTPPLMLDYQPRERLAELLGAADVHLITQAPGSSGLLVPSKLYGIMAAGRRAIYIGPPDTEVAMTIQEHQLGAVIAVGDAEALIGEIEKLSRNGGEDADEFAARARRLCREHYSQEVCCQKLTQMVESIMPASPAS